MNQEILMVRVNQVWRTCRTRGVGKRRPSWTWNGVMSLWRGWRRRHSDERLVSVLHICHLVTARDTEESSELAGIGGAGGRGEDESHGIWKQNPPNQGQWRLPAVFTRNSLRIWGFRTMSDKKWGRGVLQSHLRVRWDLSAERDPAWEAVTPHSFFHTPPPTRWHLEGSQG